MHPSRWYVVQGILLLNSFVDEFGLVYSTLHGISFLSNELKNVSINSRLLYELYIGPRFQIQLMQTSHITFQVLRYPTQRPLIQVLILPTLSIFCLYVQYLSIFDIISHGPMLISIQRCKPWYLKQPQIFCQL